MDGKKWKLVYAFTNAFQPQMEPEAISMSSQSKVANETSSLDITHPLLVGSGEIGHRNRAVRQWRAFPLNVGLPHVPKG